MERYEIGDMEMVFGLRGRDDWRRLSYRVTYGLPVRLNRGRCEFDFNLKGELKRISGRPPEWPNPQEQLKRTDADDYIYYGAFGYESAHSITGSFYVLYNGRSDPEVFNERPFEQPHVPAALRTFDSVVEAAARTAADSGIGPRARDFFRLVARNGRSELARNARRLHSIIGGAIPVLPPDTLTVDYEVIPVVVSEGCEYQCGFCDFRESGFSVRSRDNVDTQISRLRDFYGEDLVNYNAVLLGGNDALAAGAENILHAAEAAYDGFGIENSYHTGSYLFMFGSLGAFLGADAALFRRLEALPYETYINIGLESPDERTLEALGKPVSPAQVRDTFMRAAEINEKYQRIHVTSNFVVGDELPSGHLEAVRALLSEDTLRRGRDTVYLSPLIGASSRRETIRQLMEVKRAARPQVFLYLFQRL